MARTRVDISRNIIERAEWPPTLALENPRGSTFDILTDIGDVRMGPYHDNWYK
jgi:hypothetical protein